MDDSGHVTQDARLLAELSDLSREFGGPRYVHGGGGNSSVKDGAVLWIKPSGRALAALEPGSFIGLDRAALAGLHDDTISGASGEREPEARRLLIAAVLDDSTGRPSVETPLHDAIPARFIVHTHPALVNGLTCAREGEAACDELFPGAFWIPYVDPGLTLARSVRTALAGRGTPSGREGIILFLQNHGVFVAADEPDRIRSHYARIMDTLAEHYRLRGIDPAPGGADSPRAAEGGAGIAAGPDPDDVPDSLPPEVHAAARRLLAVWPGSETPCLAIGAGEETFGGPLTPDHIVYAGREPLTGEPTPEAIAAYRERFGYDPRVLTLAGVTCGTGDTPARAALALELARDAAAVIRLSEAFGGIRYLADGESRFIESWEVEQYRRRQL